MRMLGITSLATGALLIVFGAAVMTVQGDWRNHRTAWWEVGPVTLQIKRNQANGLWLTFWVDTVRGGTRSVWLHPAGDPLLSGDHMSPEVRDHIRRWLSETKGFTEEQDREWSSANPRPPSEDRYWSFPSR